MTSSCGKYRTPHLPDTTKQAWLPLLLVVHSVPKCHPHVTPQGMWCPSSLCCEYMWLMNCCLFHLSSARCCMLGHPHTLRVGIPPLPMGWRGGDSGTLNSSCPKKLEAWLLCSHCAKSCFLEPTRPGTITPVYSINHLRALGVVTLSAACVFFSAYSDPMQSSFWESRVPWLKSFRSLLNGRSHHCLLSLLLWSFRFLFFNPRRVMNLVSKTDDDLWRGFCISNLLTSFKWIMKVTWIWVFRNQRRLTLVILIK